MLRYPAALATPSILSPSSKYIDESFPNTTKVVSAGTLTVDAISYLVVALLS